MNLFLLLAIKAVNYIIYAMSLIGRLSSPKQYDFFRSLPLY